MVRRLIPANALFRTIGHDMARRSEPRGSELRPRLSCCRLPARVDRGLVTAQVPALSQFKGVTAHGFNSRSPGERPARRSGGSIFFGWAGDRRPNRGPNSRDRDLSSWEDGSVPRTWLSIRVELVEGGGDVSWPRPGRVFAASRSHTFADLASAIDDTFARWDLAHLHQFWLSDGRRVTTPGDWDEVDDEGEAPDDCRLRLGSLSLGDAFVYEFDFGDPDPKGTDLPAIGPWQWRQ